MMEENQRPKLTKRARRERLINKLCKIGFYLFCVLCGLALVGLLAAEICAWVMYGGKPIDEVPLWAIWFMFGGR